MTMTNPVIEKAKQVHLEEEKTSSQFERSSRATRERENSLSSLDSLEESLERDLDVGFSTGSSQFWGCLDLSGVLHDSRDRQTERNTELRKRKETSSAL